VGFISRLPHALVDAFKSTLEEVLYADVIVHVRDASLPPHLSEEQAACVVETLASLGVDESRLEAMVEVHNKVG
jgi:GTP-binding protein HflX